MRLPPRGPSLKKLKHFKVNHPSTEARADAHALDKWIRLVVQHAPLEELWLDTKLDCTRIRHDRFGPTACHDGLIQHLAARHSQTLRVLKMEECYVSTRAYCLISRCARLCDLRIGINGYTLVRSVVDTLVLFG
jgi:hypothetical protein